MAALLENSGRTIDFSAGCYGLRLPSIPESRTDNNYDRDINERILGVFKRILGYTVVGGLLGAAFGAGFGACMGAITGLVIGVFVESGKEMIQFSNWV